MRSSRAGEDATLQDIALMEEGLQQASSDAFKMLARVLRAQRRGPATELLTNYK